MATLQYQRPVPFGSEGIKCLRRFKGLDPPVACGVEARHCYAVSSPLAPGAACAIV